MRTALLAIALVALAGCTKEQHEDWSERFNRIEEAARTTQAAVSNPIVKEVVKVIPGPVQPASNALESILGVVALAAGSMAEWQRRKANEAKRERNYAFNQLDGKAREKVVAKAKSEKSLLNG